MITEEMKKSYILVYPEFPVLINCEMEADEWIAAGRPAIVNELERKNGYVAAVESSYGKILLFSKTGELLATGSHEAVSDKVVVLDKYYHGVQKYLWF